MASFEFDSPASVAARLERGFRRRVARRLLHEAGKVRGDGTTVRMLAPGPEDLAAIGANVMEASRRLNVLATSLRTSRAAARDAVHDAEPGGLASAG
jgi:NTE family protein